MGSHQSDVLVVSHVPCKVCVCVCVHINTHTCVCPRYLRILEILGSRHTLFAAPHDADLRKYPKRCFLGT